MHSHERLLVFAVSDVRIGRSYTVLYTGKFLHIIFAVLLTTSTLI